MVAGGAEFGTGNQKSTQGLAEMHSHHTEGVWLVGVSDWCCDGDKTS